jgi:hypothetical protein
MRSRDGNAWVIETMRNAAAVAVNYAAAFGLPIPVFDTEADIRAAWAARSTPEARAKREAANAKAKARREAKELEERRLASIAWVEGGTKRPPYGGPVLLRVQGDTLETSMGARVPLADAIRVFRAVAACRAKGVGWKRNGETLPVGHFQVDLIAPSGDFVAGCHRIGWPEVERLAGKLGLL